jgi:hypothetical protein
MSASPPKAATSGQPVPVSAILLVWLGFLGNMRY